MKLLLLIGLVLIVLLEHANGKFFGCKIKQNIKNTKCKFWFDINKVANSRVQCKKAKETFNMTNLVISDPRICQSLSFTVNVTFDGRRAQLEGARVTGPTVILQGPPGQNCAAAINASSLFPGSGMCNLINLAIF